MLSVIIPVYNAEKYIDNCLRSVLSQKNADFEVVLVNDGSTDRTDELCLQWCGEYKNLIYLTQENQGQGSARNYAVTHASGQWLVFLDADDEMCPGALEELEKMALSDFDIVFYEFFLRRKSDIVDEYIELSENVKDKKDLIREMTSFLWDKMIRRDFWRQHEIELENNYGEDLKTVYLLSAKCRQFGLLRKPLVRHYERDDNLSSNACKVMQITESIEETIEAFLNGNLLECYRVPLFYMVYRQYLLYQAPAFCDFEPEQLSKIQEKLKQILRKYFGGILTCLEMMKKTELLLVGRNFEKIYRELAVYAFHVKSVSEYDELERFVITDNKSEAENQLYLLDLSGEGRTCLFGTRSWKWQRERWKDLVDEFLYKASRRGKIKGVVICGGINCYTQELVTGFREKIPVSMVEETIPLIEIIQGCFSKPQDICPCDEADQREKFWCKGEQYRLQYNEAVLNAWMKVKFQGKSFDSFFQKYGYKKVAIYGMGYLGERLLDELYQSNVEVVYGIEKDKKESDRLRMYVLQEEWPQVDAIVVSVVHLFFGIKYELEQKTDIPILSLENIIEYLLGDRHGYIKNGSA